MHIQKQFNIKNNHAGEFPYVNNENVKSYSGQRRVANYTRESWLLFQI